MSNIGFGLHCTFSIAKLLLARITLIVKSNGIYYYFLLFIYLVS